MSKTGAVIIYWHHCSFVGLHCLYSLLGVKISIKVANQPGGGSLWITVAVAAPLCHTHVCYRGSWASLCNLYVPLLHMSPGAIHASCVWLYMPCVLFTMCALASANVHKCALDLVWCYMCRLCVAHHILPPPPPALTESPTELRAQDKSIFPGGASYSTTKTNGINAALSIVRISLG